MTKNFYCSQFTEGQNPQEKAQVLKIGGMNTELIHVVCRDDTLTIAMHLYLRCVQSTRRKLYTT